MFSNTSQISMQAPMFILPDPSLVNPSSQFSEKIEEMDQKIGNKRQRTESENSQPEAKKLKLSPQSPVVQKVQEIVENEELFPLTDPYNKFETLPINFKKKLIHVYPTEKVWKAAHSYMNRPIPEQIENLKSQFKNKNLNVHEDTTVYYPKEFKNQIEVSVENKENKLYRNNKELSDKLYIFVLSRKDRLFVVEKKLKGKHGRVHHSSVVRGKPVRTAGMIKIEKCDDGSRTILITNASGHYKPTPESLDKIVKWLEDKQLMFNISEDKVEEKKIGKVRSITLLTSPQGAQT